MSEQCAWAIGNVASESEHMRNLLLKQGALLHLGRLMASPSPSLARTATWAMSNLIKVGLEFGRFSKQIKLLIPRCSLFLSIKLSSLQDTLHIEEVIVNSLSSVVVHCQRVKEKPHHKVCILCLDRAGTKPESSIRLNGAGWHAKIPGRTCNQRVNCVEIHFLFPENNFV